MTRLVLVHLSDHADHPLADFIAAIADRIYFAEDERAELLPSGTAPAPERSGALSFS